MSNTNNPSKKQKKKKHFNSFSDSINRMFWENIPLACLAICKKTSTIFCDITYALTVKLIRFQNTYGK